MHISGILAVVSPESFDACSRDLEALPGIEIHFAYPGSGRFILTQETATVEEQEQGLRRIQSIPEVLLAELVYHTFESEAV